MLSLFTNDLVGQPITIEQCFLKSLDEMPLNFDEAAFETVDKYVSYLANKVLHYNIYSYCGSENFWPFWFQAENERIIEKIK